MLIPDRDPDRRQNLTDSFLGHPTRPRPFKKFRQNLFATFSVIYRTDRETDRKHRAIKHSLLPSLEVMAYKMSVESAGFQDSQVGCS